MIADLKPYSAMKDSGVEWLGEVPEHWEVRRLKYLLHEQDTRSTTGNEQLLCVSQYTGVTERKSINGKDEPDTRAASLVGYKCVNPNELVVNIMLAWNGSMGVSAFTGIASPAYCVYQFNNRAVPWYFHNLLRSPAYKARIKVVSTGVVESRLRLYTNYLYCLEGLLPPLPEQTTIVRYLDHVDRRVRRFVRAKQKLIGLLEEQKQAIIHSAVTRGLDPDVPLKESGVEWLGEVPEHWEVVKLSYRFSCTSGSTPSRSNSGYYGGKIPWVKTGELVDSEIEKADEHITQAAVNSLPLKLLPVDTLLIAMYGQGQTRGRTGLLKIEATINQACLAVLPNPRHAIPEYLQLWFISQYQFFRFISDARNTTQPNLNANIVKGHKVLLPPIKEQESIIKSIKTATEVVNRAANEARREIELLREYRTRLIADVVTGKLDVREAAAQLPTDDEGQELIKEKDVEADGEDNPELLEALDA